MSRTPFSKSAFTLSSAMVSSWELKSMRVNPDHHFFSSSTISMAIPLGMRAGPPPIKTATPQASTISSSVAPAFKHAST
jgi:hypothetical protein